MVGSGLNFSRNFSKAGEVGFGWLGVRLLEVFDTLNGHVNNNVKGYEKTVLFVFTYLRKY